MGLADVFKGLFSRRDPPVEPLVLSPGEAEVAGEVATWRTATLTTIDGYLVLTTERVVFASDADGDRIALLTWSLRGIAAGAPAGPGAGADDVMPRPFAIAAVEVGADSSLVNPPGLVLVDTAGRRVEIGILATRLTPNLSGANAAARDRMVAAIRSAITASITDAAADRRAPRHAADQGGFSWFTGYP